MSLKSLRPTSDREWRAIVGFPEKKYLKLLDLFEKAYASTNNLPLGDRMAHTGASKPVFEKCEELLFFTLYSLKSAITYDRLGFSFGMDQATAKRNETLGLKLLQLALKIDNQLPVREFHSVADFRNHFYEDATLVIDGMEQRIPRPVDKTEQEGTYSGKKKPHAEVPGDNEHKQTDLLP